MSSTAALFGYALQTFSPSALLTIYWAVTAPQMLLVGLFSATMAVFAQIFPSVMFLIIRKLTAIVEEGEGSGTGGEDRQGYSQQNFPTSPLPNTKSGVTPTTLNAFYVLCAFISIEFFRALICVALVHAELLFRQRKGQSLSGSKFGTCFTGLAAGAGYGTMMAVFSVGSAINFATSSGSAVGGSPSIAYNYFICPLMPMLQHMSIAGLFLILANMAWTVIALQCWTSFIVHRKIKASYSSQGGKKSAAIVNKIRVAESGGGGSDLEAEGKDEKDDQEGETAKENADNKNNTADGRSDIQPPLPVVDTVGEERTDENQFLLTRSSARHSNASSSGKSKRREPIHGSEEEEENLITTRTNNGTGNSSFSATNTSRANGNNNNGNSKNAKLMAEPMILKSKENQREEESSGSHSTTAVKPSLIKESVAREREEEDGEEVEGDRQNKDDTKKGERASLLRSSPPRVKDGGDRKDEGDADGNVQGPEEEEETLSPANGDGNKNKHHHHHHQKKKHTKKNPSQRNGGNVGEGGDNKEEEERAEMVVAVDYEAINPSQLAPSQARLFYGAAVIVLHFIFRAMSLVTFSSSQAGAQASLPPISPASSALPIMSSSAILASYAGTTGITSFYNTGALSSMPFLDGDHRITNNRDAKGGGGAAASLLEPVTYYYNNNNPYYFPFTAAAHSSNADVLGSCAVVLPVQGLIAASAVMLAAIVAWNDRV